MTGLLQAITSIPWGVVLIGAGTSCAALIAPVLMAIIAFIGAGPDARRLPAPWVRSDLVQLRNEVDRAGEALTAAEAHLLAGSEVPEELAEWAVDSEEAERIRKVPTQLRTVLARAVMGHLRRPWWLILLQKFAGTYLMYLFIFILGVIVTLLATRPQ